MVLTDDLIDRLHAQRVGSLELTAEALKTILPAASGKAVGGGYAMFGGVDSPLTQVYGVGHRDAPFDLAEIDEFFEGKASNWEFIVTPFASQAVLREASAFGYVTDHFETVLAQYATPQAHQNPAGVTVEEVTGDLGEWMRTSEAGWLGQPALADLPSEMTQILSASRSRRFLARFNGEPAAIASLGSFDGTYYFNGASTRVQFRGKGLQTALTHFRLREAGEGSLVRVVALAGSQSHRNLQRVGFQPLYSKLVMFRHP